MLLGSMTALARATMRRAAQGKILSGGIDSKALQRPKRFFAPRATLKRRS